MSDLRCGVSYAIGEHDASSAAGNYSVSSATGDYGVSSATGYRGESYATGERGASLVTGSEGRVSVENKESIAVACGYKSQAKGVLGSYLVFADWEFDEQEEQDWTLKDVKMVQVDGKSIKSDTWYGIEGGVIVEKRTL